MNFKSLACAVAAVFLAAAGASTQVLAAGTDGLAGLQAKVNESAKRAGVPAPDVRDALAGKGEAKEKSDGEKARADQLSRMPRIERIVAVPTNAVRAVEGSDGKILYLVDGGRFALVGTMVDVWHRKKLETIEDVEDAVSHINLNRMGFDLARTNHVTVGTGGEHVTLFVDPRCGWCHKLLEEVAEDEELFRKYTFDIVVVAVLGDDSRRLAERLHCAKETNQKKKFEALLAGRSGITKLEENPSCDRAILKTTELQQHALDINAVPMVVSPDHRFVRGKPESLRAFLDVEEAKLARERARAEEQAKLKRAEKELASGGTDGVAGKKRVPLRPEAEVKKAE